MTSPIQTLTGYATSLAFNDIPDAAVARAKACLADTVAVGVYGARFPWSRIIMQYALQSGRDGRCTLFGAAEQLSPPLAALANGALAHAFELDNLRQPGAGVHPGATVAVPALAMAQETGASGKDLITALVAGCEVMFRIGLASKHTSEKLGFHAPGLTGVYGGAIAAGKLLGLNAEQMTHAMGIAGSLSSGLLEFSKSGSGGMVKRLHLGRAAEGGILAASLAQGGFDGPASVLDGPFGFLNVFCAETDPDALTAGLGERYETLRICLKRYACHVTAQAPVQSTRALMTKYDFSGDDVNSMTIHCSDKVLSHHNIPDPGDLMLLQYSVPYCVALALHRDPDDPDNFNDEARADPAIRDTVSRITLAPHEAPQTGAWASTIKIFLHDGRSVARVADNFKGSAETPLSDSELAAKFLRLTAPEMGRHAAESLCERLAHLETQDDISNLFE